MGRNLTTSNTKLKRRLGQTAIVVAGGVLLASVVQFARGQPGGAPDASPVTAVEVVRDRITEVVPLSGTSVPVRRALVSPRVEGLVAKMHVDEGAWVKPGDRILSLDAHIAEIEIKVAEARVAEAEVRRKDAVRRREELKGLIDQKHVSETSLESAMADAEAAAAALLRERAELDRYRELLDRHTVFAPFAGMVVRKHVEEGQWANTDTAVVELVAVDTIRVRAPLPQRYYPRVRPGAEARVKFEALPERTFEGTVFARVASGNEATRSFPVLIDIANPDHLLAPGMSAQVFLELGGDGTESLLVPRDAVVTKADGSRQVWRIEDNGDGLEVAPVAIRTGRAHGDRLEVIDGLLKSGERIVLLGNERLRPGQAVRLRSTSDTGGGS